MFSIWFPYDLVCFLPVSFVHPIPPPPRPSLILFSPSGLASSFRLLRMSAVHDWCRVVFACRERGRGPCERVGLLDISSCFFSVLYCFCFIFLVYFFHPSPLFPIPFPTLTYPRLLSLRRISDLGMCNFCFCFLIFVLFLWIYRCGILRM